MRKNKIKSISLFLVFAIISFLVLVPFLEIILASFKPAKELFRSGMNLNIDLSVLSLNNYKYLFTGDHNYFTWYSNSIIIAAIQIVVSLLMSAFVAYGFSMYDFKFKNILFVLVLIVMMVPLEIIMLPLYVLVGKLGVIDTKIGVIIPFITSPTVIFFFRQYLKGIPKELVDAARIDGCNEYSIFFRIIMPIMKPAFAAMSIFQAMAVWNAFLWPLLVLRSKENFTLPIGLSTLLTPYGNNYDLLIAGSVIAIIPIFIIFLFFQRYFIEGMTAGSVKG